MTLRSEDLTPGTKVQWIGPLIDDNARVVVLDRRKQPDDDHGGLPFHPGWWLKRGRGGLADAVIDAGTAWAVLDG